MHGGEWSFRERLCSIPPANRDFQLISRKKTRATWHALITQAFLPPPVIKVISCDYVSVHPGLGVLGSVESFRVFARLFDFLSIERLHQVVVGFP